MSYFFAEFARGASYKHSKGFVQSKLTDLEGQQAWKGTPPDTPPHDNIITSTSLFPVLLGSYDIYIYIYIYISQTNSPNSDAGPVQGSCLDTRFSRYKCVSSG